MDKRDQALNKAIKLLGGKVPFASALVVSGQRVDYWIKEGHCPPEFCPTIERLVLEKTGKRNVTCEQLAPKVEWEFLRMQAAE